MYLVMPFLIFKIKNKVCLINIFLEKIKINNRKLSSTKKIKVIHLVHLRAFSQETLMMLLRCKEEEKNKL